MYSWAQVQEIMQNSVVQVISQVATFNWSEPYRVEEQHEGRGTGFFIDCEGHLITNAHVVDQAKTIWIHVPMLGKKPLFAHIVSFCPDRDLALLRIDAAGRDLLNKALSGIVPLMLGDSDQVQHTDSVLVLGYPLGQYGIKSSTGVISGRELGDGRTFIQITAPINPGNSGGPLLNTRGEVIGIAISTVFLAQNVGYAIPVNELKIVLDDLYSQKFVRQTSLGIQFNYASDEHAQLLGNPIPAGFYVNRVFPGSLLEKAGVREGDMIYALNQFQFDLFGEVVVPWSRDKVSIQDLVARLAIGDTVNLVLYRNGVLHEIIFTFELVDPYPIRYIYPDYEHVGYEILGGMVVMQLTDNHLELLAPVAPNLFSYTDINQKTEPRLIISHILPGSLVQQSRCFEAGDIIAQVNGVFVRTLDDFVHAVLAEKNKPFLTIKTEQGVFGVFSLQKIIEDEERLSRDFSYPVSSISKLLMSE